MIVGTLPRMMAGIESPSHREVEMRKRLGGDGADVEGVERGRKERLAAQDLVLVECSLARIGP
jgi:hypothetical protein